MARPYWTGNIQISLVSFGVSLYVATESKSEIWLSSRFSRKTGEGVFATRKCSKARLKANEGDNRGMSKMKVAKELRISGRAST